jgi:predicted amidohydrolase YtcJ
MLVDDLYLLHGVDEAHKPLQRGVQALEKDRFNQVVKRAAAHGMATGLHIAGGGDEND